MSEQAKPIPFVIKPYTKKELCTLYGISPYILRGWLKDIPETAQTGRKNFLTIPELEAILKARGVPGVRQFE